MGSLEEQIEEKAADLLASHDKWKEVADNLQSDEFGDEAAGAVSVVAPENNLRRADDAEDGLPSALKAFALAMNVLSYLSTDHGVATDFSPAPPQRIAQKLHNGTPRQRKIAREEATRLGIIPVQVVGRGILTEDERAAISDKTVRPPGGAGISGGCGWKAGGNVMRSDGYGRL